MYVCMYVCMYVLKSNLSVTLFKKLFCMCVCIMQGGSRQCVPVADAGRSLGPVVQSIVSFTKLLVRDSLTL